MEAARLMGAKSEGLVELAADLQKAADTVVEQGKKVVGQGCLNIKRDAQRIVRGASHRGYLPHYPRSITYDVTREGDSVSVEIGPERGRLQGGLGAILEFGTSHSPPIPHLSPALDAEAPGFERYLGDLAGDLLEGARARG